ncbi:hypothetical protein J6590_018987 [Homalodisca vitripennis]|nr:hypothetical protein J6590_018987 [Homalodisca vitripennis]
MLRERWIFKYCLEQGNTCKAICWAVRRVVWCWWGVISRSLFARPEYPDYTEAERALTHNTLQCGTTTLSNFLPAQGVGYFPPTHTDSIHSILHCSMF